MEYHKSLSRDIQYVLHSLPCKHQHNNFILPMYATTVNHWHSLWSVKFTIKTSRRACGIGGWYTWPFTYLHRYRSHGVRSCNFGGEPHRPQLMKPHVTLCLLHLWCHFTLTVTECHLHLIHYNQCGQLKINEVPCCLKIVSFLYL
jgi:hypothetical protein